MSFDSQLASLIDNIDINMEDGDEMTVESTDQAPQAAVASTPKNNQTRRNPEQKHVTKSFDPYTIIARDVIQNILGKKRMILCFNIFSCVNMF